MRSEAGFSEDRRYRYWLLRRWDETRPACTFVMLNPSTADESTDDPTIRRCLGFAKAWGYGSLVVVNLFALRATDPSELYTAEDPVGPENDRRLRDLGWSTVVVAWGAHGDLRGRGDHVLRELLPRRVFRLGLLKNGQPRHPLYLRRDAALEFAR